MSKKTDVVSVVATRPIMLPGKEMLHPRVPAEIEAEAWERYKERKSIAHYLETGEIRVASKAKAATAAKASDPDAAKKAADEAAAKAAAAGKNTQG